MTCVGNLCKSIIRGIPTQNSTVPDRITVTRQAIDLSAVDSSGSNNNIAKLCSGSCQLLIGNRICAFAGVKNIYPDNGRLCIGIGIIQAAYCFSHIVSRPWHRAKNIQRSLINPDDDNVTGRSTGFLIKSVRERLIKSVQNAKPNDSSNNSSREKNR